MATKNAKPDYQAEGIQLPLATKYPSTVDAEYLDFNLVPGMNLKKRESRFKRGNTAEFLETYMKDEIVSDITPQRHTIIQSVPEDILSNIGITGDKITQPKSMPKSFIQFDLFPEMELESLIGFESHGHQKQNTEMVDRKGNVVKESSKKKRPKYASDKIWKLR